MSDSTGESSVLPVRREAASCAVRESRVIKLGQKLPALTDEQQRVAAQGPDWVSANPKRIAAALAKAQKLTTGGWFTLGASRKIRAAMRGGPIRRTVAGEELVLWQHGEQIRAAPNACPHMGARLDDARVCEGRLVCPWHGLELGDAPRGSWRPLPVHDDGVLSWVQLTEEGQTPTAAPVLPVRPELFVDAVIELEAVCRPEDVIANRLDPWHGVYLHPYGFAELALTGEVEREGEHHMLLRVAKRVLGPICVEVDISFHCPSARCITMTILDGEGRGSIVETHATPLGIVDGEPRCAVIEATLASSDRPGFAYATKIASLIRPFMRKSAAALWADDIPYAERLYELRSKG